VSLRDPPDRRFRVPPADEPSPNGRSFFARPGFGKTGLRLPASERLYVDSSEIIMHALVWVYGNATNPVGLFGSNQCPCFG